MRRWNRPGGSARSLDRREKFTQRPAPFHTIARGRAGPNLLVMILDSTFGQKVSPAQSAERNLRPRGHPSGVSTLADWVGACTLTLAPLVAMIQANVLARERIHGGNTKMRVLAKIKTIIGRLWTYVRDAGRFWWPGAARRGVLSLPGSGGRTSSATLGAYSAVVRADAYGGFDKLHGVKVSVCRWPPVVLANFLTSS
jgi:transposase